MFCLSDFEGKKKPSISSIKTWIVRLLVTWKKHNNSRVNIVVIHVTLKSTCKPRSQGSWTHAFKGKWYPDGTINLQSFPPPQPAQHMYFHLPHSQRRYKENKWKSRKMMQILHWQYPYHILMNATSYISSNWKKLLPNA